MSLYNYKRRRSTVAHAGHVNIGGDNPVVVQSMANTSTMDTAASAAQAIRISEAGGELVRFTTQGVREAVNMAEIRRALDAAGCNVPLVADVHFNPRAAFSAAETCQKVRINPGNFVDAARTFRKLEFTDEEYAAEIERIRRQLKPFLALCREHDTCVRLGVNHGSLSDRIMSRYGDTPAGMVESVMEYLRICREENFDNIVISIKASNVTVMVETVRLLVAEMERESMAFPLHLGVTEAGDGEDGRVKSAVGIGTLLAEGIGDTIRVSLSEAPEAEIPVARALRDYISLRSNHCAVKEPETVRDGAARNHAILSGLLSHPYPVVAGLDYDRADTDDWHYADASEEPHLYDDMLPVVLTSSHLNRVGEIASWIDRFVAMDGRNPIVVRLSFDTSDPELLQVQAGADFGALLLNGYASGIDIVAPAFDENMLHRVALGILQAARLRISHTEYIACPSCGRTLFDLVATLAEVKAATAHLTGLKIGVMGCIVNGPGEMADADYGYVGAGPDRVSLYKGKELVLKNVTRAEALPALIELIKANGDWREPGSAEEN
ncbi:MAG: (E)-4-hydroxy-3-methylbut-2-enyl-diphosphate synthase [Bacteroides sp.]|nr:(E)-4-hydroxy-3-methylbut-2-enyl-diphosphate synthase [Bacteroides sp.]